MKKEKITCAECGEDWPYEYRGYMSGKQRVCAKMCTICASRYHRENKRKSNKKLYIDKVKQSFDGCVDSFVEGLNASIEENSQFYRKTRRKINGIERPSQRSRILKRNYGIDIEEYNKMLALQNGVCAICKREETSVDRRTDKRKNLSVDHNHQTGEVRSLLCVRCNTTLGRVEENMDILISMYRYLERWNDAS